MNFVHFYNVAFATLFAFHSHNLLFSIYVAMLQHKKRCCYLICNTRFCSLLVLFYMCCSIVVSFKVNVVLPARLTCNIIATKAATYATTHNPIAFLDIAW